VPYGQIARSNFCPVLVGGGGADYYYGGGGGILRVVVDEEFCFGGVVGGEVVGPAEADGLVPEFGFDLERALGVVERDGIFGQAAGGGEVGIVGGFSGDGDIFSGGLFVEAGGEQAIVF